MFIKQSTAVRNLVFRMLSTTDGFTPTTGLTVTVTLSKNGAAFAAAAGAVTEIANGYYAVAANATDSNTLGGLMLYATGTGAKGYAQFEIVAFDPRSETNLGLSGLPTAAPGAADGLLIAGTNVATSFSEGIVITKSTGTALVISSETGMSITGTTSNGLNISGDAAGMTISGNLGTGLTIFGAEGVQIFGLTSHGVEITGQGVAAAGVTIQAPNGIALSAQGDTAGFSISTNTGHGLAIIGGVNSSGIHVATQGNGDGLTLVHSGSGVDLRANITGNLTGNVTGSVGSVAGNVTGNVIGNVNGSVHALDAGAIVANTITDGALTAAKFGSAFIVGTSFATSADTHLGAAIGPEVFKALPGTPTAGSYGDLLVNFGQPIESGLTFKQAIRAMAAVAAGNSTGGGSGNVHFKAAGGSADRVVADVDANGNRTNATITA